MVNNVQCEAVDRLGTAELKLDIPRVETIKRNRTTQELGIHELRMEDLETKIQISMCFFRTQGTRCRQWTPSREEILCTTNRRPCYSKFYFMDGQYYSIEFQPSSTANDVLEIIKKKIGLQDNAKGYSIYEVIGNSERSLSSEEKVCDVMAKWEKYQVTSQQGFQVTFNTIKYYFIDN
ncbi:uncharacterized protein Dsimw501_GD27666 [Drosophila simulans]|uniref:Ras-associating domain-containing protein n=1 Tax=Drosophila simulans TaxID=7240 RepID=A0A0J9R7B8_DROSI|nr:uncharacterized protein Dsimw501_GD27666 [Drosophila simulans]